MQLGDDAPAIAKRLTTEIYRMQRGETAQTATVVQPRNQLSAFRDVLNAIRVLFRRFGCRDLRTDCCACLSRSRSCFSSHN